MSLPNAQLLLITELERIYSSRFLRAVGKLFHECIFEEIPERNGYGSLATGHRRVEEPNSAVICPAIIRACKALTK
jgi:hypothetical protein